MNRKFAAAFAGAVLFRAIEMTSRKVHTLRGQGEANQRRNAGTSRNGIIPSTTLTSENAINGP